MSSSTTRPVFGCLRQDLDTRGDLAHHLIGADSLGVGKQVPQPPARRRFVVGDEHLERL